MVIRKDDFPLWEVHIWKKKNKAQQQGLAYKQAVVGLANNIESSNTQ